MSLRLCLVSRSMLALALLAAVHTGAHAVGWSDDFNDMNAEDGNPVTWTYNEVGATPGIYTAATGDYALSAPGDGTDNSSLVASVNVSFQNTYIRSQMISLPGPIPEEEIGGNVGVFARLDPSSLSGYVAILDHEGQLELLRVDGGEPFDVIPRVPGTGFDALTDVIMELDVVGDQLSVFAWRPGESKPETPLATGQDATYTSGRAGIVFNEDDDNTTGLFRWAMAQDAPFVDATPGDFDVDGDVDGGDFIVWQQGAHTPGDLADWQANYGAGGAVGSIAAVPEPAGLLTILAAGLAGVAAARSRRPLRNGRPVDAP